MDYSIQFWDRIADRYAKKPVVDETMYRQKLALTQQYFRADMNVLEFGCGTGSTAIVHAPYVKRYQAIDVSSNMIAIAQRKLAGTGIDNLTFSVEAFEDFSAPNQSFDAILGLSILHLLNDPEAAIARVFSMLQPGGIFVTSTACIADFMPYFRLIAPVGSLLRVIPMVKVFSKCALEQYMTKTGFDIRYRLVSPRKSGGYFLIAAKPATHPQSLSTQLAE